MPKRFDKQAAPVGLKKASTGKKWNHVDSLGDFKGIKDKVKPDRLTRDEKAKGVKLTDWDKNE